MAKPRREPKPKSKAKSKRPPQARPKSRSVREGGTRVSVTNSGLEVWLYDDANREAIRRAGPPDTAFGGMPPVFGESTAKGLIVGYSLYQDDDVAVEVHVGDPFTDDELSIGRWLEPQVAFLRLPSGVLRIESNDASRIGLDEPMAEGVSVDVPPGDYRLTLLRLDHEALDREGIAWQGPQEVILLTPGGTRADAAEGLLPFEHRRDLSWVGKYSIQGGRAHALVWFNDYWDTFFLNLDSTALSAMGIGNGSYFRTHVPAAAITLVSVVGPTWEEARRMQPPSGITLEEYGYGSLSRPQEWGAETLFCRRDTTKTCVEDPHHNIWLLATVELLDPAAHPPRATERGVGNAELRTKRFFDDQFLTFILCDVFPDVADLEGYPLPDAIDRLDGEFATWDLVPVGDIDWTQDSGVARKELTVRLYTGLADTFSAIIAGEGPFEILFLSEMDDGTWVVTGLANELGTWTMVRGRDGLDVPHPKIRLTEVDEPLPKMRAAHKRAVGKAKTAPAPSSLEEAVEAFMRFMSAIGG